tara:strand:- start:19298 stop:19780 length:483 start_codon:yes stop_codon:yes gene_type:complete
MAEKIPLKEILGAMDRKDFDWFSRLSDEKKKQWSSWLFLRYASSAKGKDKEELLLNTNEFVNKYYKDLFKYPELMWKLFCLTSTGRSQFHEYIKPPNSRVKTDTVSQFILRMFPHMKSDEIDLFRNLNSIDDIKQMAVDLGLTDKELDEIFGKTKKRKKK